MKMCHPNHNFVYGVLRALQEHTELPVFFFFFFYTNVIKRQTKKPQQPTINLGLKPL